MGSGHTLATFNRDMEPFSGALHSEEGDKKNRGKKLWRVNSALHPPIRPWTRGPRSSCLWARMSPGAAGGEPGGQGGGSRDRLSLSRHSSPGNTLQLHLFRVACLKERSKQFQDYISLSHLFAGVSVRPGRGLPCCSSFFVTHTQRHTPPERQFTVRYTSRHTEDTQKHTISHTSWSHKLGVHGSGLH